MRRRGGRRRRTFKLRGGSCGGDHDGFTMSGGSCGGDHDGFTMRGGELAGEKVGGSRRMRGGDTPDGRT